MSWIKELKLQGEEEGEIREISLQFRKMDASRRKKGAFPDPIYECYKYEEESNLIPTSKQNQIPPQKKNPHGRGLGIDTVRKKDEQVFGAEKLKELGENKRLTTLAKETHAKGDIHSAGVESDFPEWSNVVETRKDANSETVGESRKPLQKQMCPLGGSETRLRGFENRFSNRCTRCGGSETTWGTPNTSEDTEGSPISVTTAKENPPSSHVVDPSGGAHRTNEATSRQSANSTAPPPELQYAPTHHAPYARDRRESPKFPKNATCVRTDTEENATNSRSMVDVSHGEDNEKSTESSGKSGIGMPQYEGCAGSLQRGIFRLKWRRREIVAAPPVPSGAGQ